MTAAKYDSPTRGHREGGATGSPLAGLATGDPLTCFRAAVLRRSVPVLAVAVIALGIVAAIDGYRLDVNSAAFLGTTLVGLGLATRVPWEKAAESTESWASWLWSVIVALVLGGLALVPGLASSTRPLFAAVVVMTGLVLSPMRHIFVTLLSVALVAASHVFREVMTISDVAGPLVIVGVTSLAVGFVARQLERTAMSDRDHIEDLARERSAYQRLYGLATTLGASSSIDETLPDLLGRLCSYLDSGFGAWLLADERRGVLRVVPPVLIGGEPAELDRQLEVELRDWVFVTRALRADRPLSIRVDALKREREGILGALDLHVAMAVPLIVESQRVGVLLIGDPSKGSYEQRDMDELAALAGPAGLVLAQLLRHHEAEEVAERLREVAEMKTDFVSVVSHELRTPLTSIRGALDTLVRPGLVEENTIASELIASARRQTSRLERLINDLLVASRLERGSLHSEPVPVHLSEIVDEVVQTVDFDGIHVAIDSGLVVTADPSQLAQVIRNLVENAVKYGEGTDVEVTAERVGGGVTMTVADHGRGIPVEDRQRIFDRFVQLERPDRRTQEGSGLGLAIVSSLVEAMGGRIAVDDTPGGGATLRVALRAPSLFDVRLTDHPLRV